MSETASDEVPDQLRRGAVDAHPDLGARLREERLRTGESLRHLATQVGISASALSQIETGRSRPSVGTLYAIVSNLGISLDELFVSDGAREDAARAPRTTQDIVCTPADRKVLQLESGVRWERLTAQADPEVDFLFVEYEVGGASSANGTSVRHNGREYGLVVSGRLQVTVGFEKYELGPGDSISFASSVPHRLETVGDEPARAVWFALGRHDSDPRVDGLRPTGD
jgi:transcriptional regulator with XRE-family HTH domain